MNNLAASLIPKPYDFAFFITKETVEHAMIPLSKQVQNWWPSLLLHQVELASQQVSVKLSLEAPIPAVGSAVLNLSLAFVASANASHLVLQPFLSAVTVHRIDFSKMNLTIDGALQAVNQFLNTSIDMLNKHLLPVAVSIAEGVTDWNIKLNLPWRTATISAPTISTMALLINPHGIQGLASFVLPRRPSSRPLGSVVPPTFDEAQSVFCKSWKESGFPPRQDTKSYAVASSSFFSDYLQGYLPQNNASCVKATALKTAHAGLAKVSATPDFELAFPASFLQPYLRSLESRIDSLNLPDKASPRISKVRFAGTSGSLAEQSISISSNVHIDTVGPRTNILLRVNASALCGIDGTKLTCSLSVHNVTLLNITDVPSLLQTIDVTASVASVMPTIVDTLNGIPPVSVPLVIPGFDPLPVATFARDKTVSLSGPDILFPLLELTTASMLIDSHGIYILGTIAVKPPSSQKTRPALEMQRSGIKKNVPRARTPTLRSDRSGQHFSLRPPSQTARQSE